MNKFKMATLEAELTRCTSTIKLLLCKIYEIENDEQSPITVRKEKLKIIREEINKVGMEIDKVRKEINLHGNYNVN